MRLRPGDHVCAFHFGPAQRDRLLRPYVRAGLQAGERCICVIAPSEKPALLAGLSGLSPGSRAGRGELVLAGASPLPQGNQPTRVRLVTDLGWVEQQPHETGTLAAYERDLDNVVARCGHLALCLWDLEHSDVATVMHLLMAHPKVLLGRNLVASPWYLAGPDRPHAATSGPSRIEGVLSLATLMMATTDPPTIGALAAVALGSIGPVQLDGIFVRDKGWHNTAGAVRDPKVRARIEARLVGLRGSGGALSGSGGRWGWAYPLQNRNGCFGHLLVGADSKPIHRDLFLIRLVAQEVGIALTNARLRDVHRQISRELQHTREALADATAMLDWNAVVRERLRHVVEAGGGSAEIAFAVHDMTGHSVVVEDPQGTVTSMAGPDQPKRRPTSPEQRKDLLARARLAPGPIWDDDRLVAAATRSNKVVGMISLVDPVDQVGEGEMMAVEDAATLLALELHYQRELAETEMRLGRNLLNELLDGNAEDMSARAEALGYDLTRPGRVVLVQPGRPEDPDRFFHAVRRAARDTGFGSMLVLRDADVVVLTGAAPPWERLHRAVESETMGQSACRLGIGKDCDDVSDIPRSLREATLALKLQDIAGEADPVVEFEQLGIYRVLADVAESSDVDLYVQSWLHPLKPLLDYDADNQSDLVATLSSFLESGGRHQAAANALNVHRSTLKYRIQRIKEISGCDLTDPDTVFNLQLSTRAWQTLTRLRP